VCMHPVRCELRAARRKNTHAGHHRKRSLKAISQSSVSRKKKKKDEKMMWCKSVKCDRPSYVL
jgi:hypothetical protein